MPSFDAMKELTSIRDHVNRVLGDTFSGGTTVSLDIYETESAYVVVTAPLYGLKPETLDISVADNNLTISGETAAPAGFETVQFIRRERKFGAFSRTVNIPGQIQPEATKAQLKDHLLTVTLPKVLETAPRIVKVTPVE